MRLTTVNPAAIISFARGSPQEIIDKLIRQRELLGGYDRFMAQIDLGGLPSEESGPRTIRSHGW
ncbi:hypothetical protein JCM9534A_17400 [Catenuloplanes indicus JCM 9534]